MTQILSKEDLSQLWYKDQVTLTKDHKLYLYCHKRMQHPVHVSMIRLAEQGTIPPALKHIKKAPPCAACIFAMAQKQAWRNKGGRKSSIRKKHHNTHRKGTSADHMISHQPSLIPQVTGTLTHERYWSATTMVDHANSYSLTQKTSPTLAKQHNRHTPTVALGDITRMG
eukprot:5073625-Ditylum_brightwellii.AAC.1